MIMLHYATPHFVFTSWCHTLVVFVVPGACFLLCHLHTHVHKPCEVPAKWKLYVPRIYMQETTSAIQINLYRTHDPGH